MYTSGATIPNVDVYTSDMAYQQFGQNWLPYNSFHNQSQMYPYTNDELFLPKHQGAKAREEKVGKYEGFEREKRLRGNVVKV